MPFEPALDAAAHFHHLAHGDLRQRAGELRQLDRLEDLGLGLDSDLAVLLGDEGAQFDQMALQQRLVAVKDLDPLLDRRGGPGREGAAGSGHRLVHLGGPAQRHAADDRAGGGAQHVEEARAAGHGLPADPVPGVRMRARRSAIFGRRGGSGLEGGHGFTPVG